MENLENKIITEHPYSGTEISFGHDEQLHEKLESLQLKHLEALEVQDDVEAKKIEEEINRINEELGIDQEKLAA